MNVFKTREFWSGPRGPLLAMCLPLFCSCLVWLVGSRPQTLAHVPELPGLAFDQYMVDLQEVVATEELRARFMFRNTSQHPVTITKLEPSCGCLQPQLKKTVFQPGEIGDFILRIKTVLQQPGFKEFSVTVHYTDPKPRKRDVFLRVTFPEEQIYVTPRAMTFHQPGSVPVQSELVMTDLRRNPAEILGVASSSDQMQLEVVKPETSAQGARQQRVRVIVPGPIASGRHNATVTIYTNDPDFHELKVPIQIFGPNKHSLATRPIGPQPWGPIRR